jgi:hypothetical protein
MSTRILETENNGTPIEVWLGWNAPQERYFMVLCEQGEDAFYSNLDDPHARGGASLGYYVEKSRSYGIEIPVSMIARVASDAALGVENDRSGFEQDGTEFSGGPRAPAKPGDEAGFHTSLVGDMSSTLFWALAERIGGPDAAYAAVQRTGGACLLGEKARTLFSDAHRNAGPTFDLSVFIQLVLLDPTNRTTQRAYLPPNDQSVGRA